MRPSAERPKRNLCSPPPSPPRPTSPPPNSSLSAPRETRISIRLSQIVPGEAFSSGIPQ